MELCSQLRPYLVSTNVGQMIQHPLVHQLFFGTDVETEWVNAAYEEKTRAVQAALDAGEWDLVVALHERPYRVDVLTQVPRDVPGYWGIVAAWWADTEFPTTRLDTWVELMDDPQARQMMSRTDRETFDDMPTQLRVYRGFGADGEENGLSWTVNRGKAEWFARRFAADGRSGTVVERVIAKDRVTAYLNRRNEEEVIVLPHVW